jgi:hypothetical protein
MQMAHRAFACSFVNINIKPVFAKAGPPPAAQKGHTSGASATVTAPTSRLSGPPKRR